MERLFCAVALGAALFLQCGCGQGTGAVRASAAPVTLTIGLQAPTSTNPGYGIRQVVSLISLEGLTEVNLDGRPRPRLASSWTESPDGLTWTFTLRSHIKFHDGHPLDAEAVKASIERSMSGPSPVPEVKSIEAPSPDRLIVHLKYRSQFLLEDLIMPITREGKPVPVGTGPFSLVSLSPREAVMKANENYYLGRPKIDRIVIRLYPALRAAWADMMRGKVDFLFDVGQDALDFVQRSTSVKVFQVQRPYAYAVYLSDRRPELRSPLLRQAFNAAIDRSKLIAEGLQGHGRPASGAVWPENWAVDPKAPGFEYDPKLAMQLLGKAGIPAPRATSSSSPPARITIDCLVPEGVATIERVGLLVQQQLRQFGVEFHLEPLPFNEFISRVVAGKFDAVLIDGLMGPSMGIAYWAWHSRVPGSSIGFNFEDYHDALVDRSLDAIRDARSDDAYRAGVAAFQRAILKDPPAIFLAWSETFRAVSRRFDVPVNQGQDILQSLARWTPVAPSTVQTSEP
ncbi:MAG: ABC transporter substrate-binding protein [Acidobacteriota bacterium]|nr:ABC transporter substrate-binding protein [Acidobacteriota bacterium]